MKTLPKTLVAASLLCLLAGHSTAFAQFKFGKSGGSKTSSRGFSSSPRNSGSSSSRVSSRSPSGHSGGVSKFNFGKSSTSKGSSTFKPSTPQSGRGFGGISKPTTKFPTTTKPLFGKGSSISKPSRFPGVSSKPTFPNPIGNGKTPPSTRPTTKFPGIGGSWLPGNQNSGGKTPPKGTFNNGTKPGHTAGRHPTTSVKLGHGWQHTVKNIIHNNRSHWCHSRPTKCQWWVSYCQPISHCHAHEIVVCDWNRVHCAPVVHGSVQVQEVQWYLGMKGMLLPGKGIGIEAVEPGSPAEQVGLRPGMVITVANGIPLVDETSMQEAIRISGGVLQMTLLSEDGSQVLEGAVQMAQVAAVSF